MIFLEDDYSEEAYKRAEAEANEDGFSEISEFSARARKKKRIYKRKKSAPEVEV
jgi:hypothetical protein